MSDNPQPAVSGDSSSVPQGMPQANPAQPHGPDSRTLPTLGETVGSGVKQPDYKSLYEQELARRQGQDRKINEYQQNQATLQSEFTELRQQMSTVLAAIQQPQAPKATEEKPTPQAPKAPAPVSDGNANNQPLDAISMALKLKRAEQYRDMLVEEYTKPGAKGEGLPLSLFSDRIRVIEPIVGPDNSVDDSKQREEIESLITVLSAMKSDTQSSTQKTLLEGAGPGSAAPPGAPSGPGGTYAEFLDLMQKYGEPDFDIRPRAEQAKIEQRYLELLNDPEVQRQHDGQLQPTPGVDDLYKQIRDLTNRLNAFQPGAKGL